MNAFDSAILLGLNRYAHRWPLLDYGIQHASGLYLAKGELFMAGLWGYWAAPQESRARNRSVILSTLCAAIAAIVLGRLLAHFLPFRIRPVSNPDFAFIPPVGVRGDEPFRDWSSFPSDHAMLFSALATGLLFISRRAGAAAHAFWILVIGLPRIYLGLHHPTDVIAGGVFGAALAWGANREPARRAVDSFFSPFQERHPGLFYALFFICCFQLASMFDEPRLVVNALHSYLRSHGAVPTASPTAAP